MAYLRILLPLCFLGIMGSLLIGGSINPRGFLTRLSWPIRREAWYRTLGSIGCSLHGQKTRCDAPLRKFFLDRKTGWTLRKTAQVVRHYGDASCTDRIAVLDNVVSAYTPAFVLAWSPYLRLADWNTDPGMGWCDPWVTNFGPKDGPLLWAAGVSFDEAKRMHDDGLDREALGMLAALSKTSRIAPTP